MVVLIALEHWDVGSMSNLPSGTGRRYTDREMKLIFERASEADVEAHSEQGHSLA